jgi:putative endopeptidase
MQANLESLGWMDNITRENALKKLSMVTNQIGYPEDFITYHVCVLYFTQWFLIYRRYYGLYIYQNAYFNNSLHGAAWNFMIDADQIENPTDKDLWEMTPDQVNAYHSNQFFGLLTFLDIIADIMTQQRTKWCFQLEFCNLHFSINCFLRQ